MVAYEHRAAEAHINLCSCLPCPHLHRIREYIATGKLPNLFIGEDVDVLPFKLRERSVFMHV